MFKYQIKGSIYKKTRPVTIALTNYKDIAEYILEHAAEALDPEGEHGLTVELITHPEADLYIFQPRKVETEDNDGETE